MIANGCDIRIVQQVLRHHDIRTTLRYAHVSDKTKREMYERYLNCSEACDVMRRDVYLY